MQKRNKVILALVSMLLTLVLISSCLVSEVFAKYVNKKIAKTTVGFEAFGVNVELTVDPTLEALVGANNVVWTGVGDTRSVTINNLQMVPGDAFYDALKVQVSRTPNVPVEFKMACSVDYAWQKVDGKTDGTYVVPDYISGYTSDTYLMPLGFTIHLEDECRTNDGNDESVDIAEDNVTDICRPWHNKTPDEIEDAIIRNAANKIFNAGFKTTDLAPVENGSSYYAKSYAAGTAITGNVNSFYLGVRWPLTFNTKLNSKTLDYDKIATHLSEQAAPITFTYTFSLTQTGKTT